MQLPATERWKNERVELFLMTPDQVSDKYVGWLADPEVNQYLETRFAEQDRSSVQQFVDGLLRSRDNIFFGIKSLQLDRHVGNLRLGPIDLNHRIAEIGIMVGDRASWGGGIASNALSLLAGIARAELSLRKLCASCYEGNVGSRRAFEKAGFEVEGLRPSHLLCAGEPVGVVLLGRVLD